jgi:hypothetical protein
MRQQTRRLLRTSLLAVPATLALATSGAAPNDCWMTGGGSIFDTTGSEVAYTGRTTHGFEIHCDTRNPNNLEINWGGNRFHMQDLQAANCFDDPTISPNPPDASFDTFVGVGVGKYNGTPGFCISFTFTDAGEPGTADTATIAITNCAGATVLSTSGPLVRGNHQAHSK